MALVFCNQEPSTGTDIQKDPGVGQTEREYLQIHITVLKAIDSYGRLLKDTGGSNPVLVTT